MWLCTHKYAPNRGDTVAQCPCQSFRSRRFPARLCTLFWQPISRTKTHTHKHARKLAQAFPLFPSEARWHFKMTDVPSAPSGLGQTDKLLNTSYWVILMANKNTARVMVWQPLQSPNQSTWAANVVRMLQYWKFYSEQVRSKHFPFWHQ